MAVRTLRFGVVGIFNTAVGLAVIFAAKGILGLGDLASNAFGYGVGLACSFLLNRRWTFEHQGPAVPAAVKFIVALVIAYSLNLAMVFGLRDFVGVDAYLAQALGVFPYTVFLYLASRFYVFPPAKAYAGKKG